MTAHPFAELFPMMPDENLRELAEDIKQYGLRIPVVTYGGMILDGRNRYAACQIAGVLPVPSVEYTGSNADALAFVASVNDKRRHLDASQRAMVAAKMANMKIGDNQHSDSGGSAHVRTLEPVISQGKAAETMKVSERSVNAAKHIIDHGTPELAKAVDEGKVSVSAAAEVAKLPKAEQKKIVKAGPEAVKAKAAEQRKAKTPPKPEPVIAQEPAVEESEPENTAEDDPSEAFCKTINRLCLDIDEIIRRANELKASPYSRFVMIQPATIQLKNARETLWGGRPTHECPYCAVAGEPQPSCRCCGGLNVTTKSNYKAGEAAVGVRK